MPNFAFRSGKVSRTVKDLADDIHDQQQEHAQGRLNDNADNPHDVDSLHEFYKSSAEQYGNPRYRKSTIAKAMDHLKSRGK